MGMVTGIGGGIARDLLAGRVPVVFSSELYATPALLGATWAVLASRARALGGGWSRCPGVAICFGLRVLALWRNWRAPLPRGLGQRLASDAAAQAPEHPVEVGVGEDPVGVEPVAQRLELLPARVRRREVRGGAGVQLAPVRAAVVRRAGSPRRRGSTSVWSVCGLMWKAR